MPEAQITNPAGLWGQSSTSIGQARSQSLVAATAVVSGVIVALSTTEGQVVTAATNQNIASLVGVAQEVGVAGNPMLVAVHGPVFGVVKSTAAADNFAQFDLVTISSTTTGAAARLAPTTAITQYAALGSVLGIAMAAAVTTATTVDVFVVRW